MAITDSLTGLYNHQYIFDRLEQEVKFQQALWWRIFDIDA
jgi:GGDEF domain-containing protein